MDNVAGMSLLDEKSIDLTVTSPPYDNLRTYNGFTWDFENVAKQLFRITKDGGVVVWVSGDATIKYNETGTSFRQALYFKEIGFNLYDTIIYDKNGFRFPHSGMYHQVFEYMFILSKGKPKTINLIEDRECQWGDSHSAHWKREINGELTIRKGYNAEKGRLGRRYNIWRYSGANQKSKDDQETIKHPAKFPEQLARDHILSWSSENDLVLDPFVGSGTSAKMSKLLKRNYIGFEISQEYVDIANKRLSKIV